MVEPSAYKNFKRYWEQYLPHTRHRILCYMLYRLYDQFISEVTFAELVEELSMPEDQIPKLSVSHLPRVLSKLTSNGYLSRTKYKNYSVWTLTDDGIEYASNIYKNRHYYNIEKPEWVAKMMICGVCDE